MKLFLLFLIGLLSFNAARAHCPLCVGAIGLALGAAKVFGVDVIIIGVLTGGLALSFGLMVNKVVRKQYFPFQGFMITLGSFVLTVLPLSFFSGGEVYFFFFDRFYWFDRLIFGSVIGGLTVVASYFGHLFVKQWRGGVLFPYQGVVFTLVSLLLVSGLMEWLL